MMSNKKIIISFLFTRINIELEDIKTVTRGFKMKNNREYNDQKKEDRRTNDDDLQNIWNIVSTERCVYFLYRSWFNGATY